MSTTAIRNSVSGKMLIGYVERIERLRENKKQLADDEKVVLAEAVSNGFVSKRITDVVKARAMNPHDREEAQAEFDMYMNAIGMTSEAPLFRAVGLMNVDVTVREQVVEAVKLLVPPGGEFVIKIGGAPLRVWRDIDGKAFAEDVMEFVPKPVAQTEPEVKKREPAPDVDADGAENLGRDAYAKGLAIIKNPFPWDDLRRAKWDSGWRLQSGGDGMGPSEGP